MESLLHGPTWVQELLCANSPFSCYLLSSFTFFPLFFMHGAPLFQNVLPRVIPWAASYAGCPDLLSSLAFSLSFPELHLAEHVLSLNCLACLLWWLSWRVWERVVVNAKWTISKVPHSHVVCKWDRRDTNLPNPNLLHTQSPHISLARCKLTFTRNRLLYSSGSMLVRRVMVSGMIKIMLPLSRLLLC